MKSLISIIFACTTAYIAQASGLWIDLGAHPDWSQTATIIGAVVGAILFMGIRFTEIKISSQAIPILIALIASLAVAAEKVLGKYWTK